MTDDAMMRLCDAMREQYGAGVEFELSLGELVGRYRRAFDRRQQDAEAARLLPLGREVAAERLHVHIVDRQGRIDILVRSNKCVRQPLSVQRGLGGA